MTLPFSASADRNKEVIADALQPWFADVSNVLEIGSGTGQHAVYLCRRFPTLHWWPTDRSDNLAAIAQRINESGLDNIGRPFELDVSRAVPSPVEKFDMAYSTNTAHIMREIEVEQMFSIVGELLGDKGVFALYGPFHYGGVHTSQSNSSFDQMLRQQASHMGVRDKHLLDSFAQASGLQNIEDIDMPRNNRLLLWRRSAD